MAKPSARTKQKREQQAAARREAREVKRDEESLARVLARCALRTWPVLQEGVRTHSGELGSLSRRFPDAGRALDFAAVASGHAAKDRLLEEVYQADKAGQPARTAYLMWVARS